MRPVFYGLTSDRDWAARLAWLVHRLQFEKGMKPPLTVVGSDDELDDDSAAARHRRCHALTAAMEGLANAYAAHWAAIVEADGEVPARRLVSLLECARRKAS